MKCIIAGILLLSALPAAAAPLWVADQDRITIDHGLLDRLAGKSAATFSLPVAGQEYVVQLDQVTGPNLGVTSFRGHIDDDPAAFFLLCRTSGGAVVAFFQPGDSRAYRLDRSRGYDAVYAVDQEDFAACGGGRVPPALPAVNEPSQPTPTSPNKAGETADDGSRHDILIAYTAAAETFLGGEEFILAEAQLAVDAANLAYANSGINFTLRLVHTMATSYQEIAAFSYNDHLDYLWYPNDGYLDEVPPMRDAVGADFVSVLIDARDALGNLEACGLGYVMDPASINQEFAPAALSIVSVQCATAKWSLAHEVGHNRGCAHNRENAPIDGAYTYAYGHRWPGNRTVMAYDNAGKDFTRVPYFSNPDISLNGSPTGAPLGSPNEAHNALAHNNTAAVCAGFRAERTFVEFGWSGVSTGLFVAPFTSLASGLAGSRTQGTLVINNANTGFTGILNTQRTYVHDGTGSVTLGGP